MAYDLDGLSKYVQSRYESSGGTGFTSSGSIEVAAPKQIKKNCDNCGSNQIENNECQHCGTWYGYGQKPKPVKLPPVNPQRIEYYEKPKQSFLYRALDRIFKHNK